VNLSGASIKCATFSDASLIKTDLSGANLSGADMRRCELKDASFAGANCDSVNLGDAQCFGVQFRGATLRDANLQGAELGMATFVVQSSRGHVVLSRGQLRPGHLPKDEIGDAVDFVVHEQPAQMEEVDLTDAILVGANLTGVKFSRSILRGASLLGANLTLADFAEADLARTVWGGTVLGKTDLSRCRGLGNSRHAKPTSLDLDTLIVSRGNIPASYLRGCGYHPEVQERLLRAVDSSILLNLPELRLPSCFISYSSSDAGFAKLLTSELNEHGIDYWYDAEQMKVGGAISDQLRASILARDRTILVCSSAALESSWVRFEIQLALAEEERRRLGGRTDWRVLFPITLDNALKESSDPRVVSLRNDRVIADFRCWQDRSAFNASLRKLLQGLRESTSV
jgi:uncharacterized protein YjbI with pentapeptide repeats